MTPAAEAVAVPALDPGVFEGNLAALRAVDADTAEQIIAASVGGEPPPLAATRDGSINFVRGEEGALRWHGRTSLPEARATGLVEAFMFGGNVLLYGAGSGAEIRGMLGRLTPEQAIFVLEPDAQAAADTLRLRDFRAEISARRVLWIVGPDGWERLRALLAREPGLLPPQRVLVWPWLKPADTHEISTRLTAITIEIGQSREAELARTTAAWRNATTAATGVTPFIAREKVHRITVVSPTSDADVVRLADDLSWGLGQAGFASCTYSADGPPRQHPLGLARHVAESRPEMFLLVNATRADIGACVPPGVRVVTWLSGDVAVSRALVERIGPTDSLVVTRATQRGDAVRHGIVDSRVLLAPPAARVAEPTQVRPLAVLADEADVRPSAAGLHLASHVALWEAAEAVVRERVSSLCAADVDACFADAERRSGVRISDAGLRADLLERVRAMLAPAVVHRAYVDALVEANVEFDLYGLGWGGVSKVAARWRGRRPDRATGYRAVVRLWEPAPRLDGPTLDAMAAGAAAWFRRVVVTQGKCASPPLRAGEWTEFGSPAELVKLAADSAAKSAMIAAPVSARVRDEETWVVRARTVMAAIGLGAHEPS